MSRPDCRQLLTFVALALGVWLLAPSAARAACGDYVTLPHGGAAHPDHDLPDVPAAPCHGPQCSEAPAPDRAPGAPAPTGPQTFSERGILSGSLPFPSPPAARRRPAEPLAAASVCPARVFHPPRHRA